MIRHLLPVILSFCISLAFSQYRDAAPTVPSDTLATVGPRVITSRDVIERIEMMPWPGKDKPSQMDSAKIRALQSLAAEAILSMEAPSQGVVDDSTLRMQSQNVEKLMVRDELYKREVRGKVSLTPEEIHQGLKRFARQIKALMINVGSEVDAANLIKQLRSGASVDSLARVRRLQVDSANVRFGMLEKSQEDAVYGISASKPVSDPVNVPRLGWVVLYYVESSTDPDFAKLSQSERQQTVQQKLTRRKEAVRAGSYVSNHLASRRAEVRPGPFGLLATTLHDLFAGDTVHFKNQAGYRLDMVAPAAEARLAPHLHDPLVDLEGGTMTMQEVLEAWRNFDFLIPTLEKKEFMRQMNGAVREVVMREFLVREAYRQKLQHTAAVQHDVDVWLNAWQANLLARQVVNGVKVTDQEVSDYLVAHADEFGDDYLVNIRELLSDSLSTALSLLERVVRGENFKQLAKEHSKRQGWAKDGGETGYFVVSRLPEVGLLALESDTGKILGPVKTKDGYSIFSVLGKKLRKGKGVMPYDSLKEEVRAELYKKKVSGKLDDFVAAAAKNYPVTLHYDRLKQLQISPINVVTKRMIGFGGSMPASPGLVPVFRWVDKASNVQQFFP
jgi:hypothetical protein